MALYIEAFTIFNKVFLLCGYFVLNQKYTRPDMLLKNPKKRMSYKIPIRKKSFLVLMRCNIHKIEVLNASLVVSCCLLINNALASTRLA